MYIISIQCILKLRYNHFSKTLINKIISNIVNNIENVMKMNIFLAGHRIA